MEIFLDICLLSQLNLLTANWDTPFSSVKVSNFISIALLFMVCMYPLCYLLLSCAKPALMTD